ncbi:LPS assembly lipoprotein LptE [Yoonia vestfoldensis]|uniref:LPS assembly lipoprotein LptE n=1 Tax=Yoonia vestfoldensis TaxID=245188 RepID=UPI0003A2BA0A|nr:LPS assembly lipoprotein LptE [Yoonia vestfoldensis]
MSSRTPSRRLFLLGLLALGGCGFVPVYGTDNVLRGRIAFDTRDTVPGFRLRERLEQRLGVQEVPDYVLGAQITDRRRSLAITTSGDNTRFNVIGTVTWVLTHATTGEVIANGSHETFTSYSATGSTTATQAAEADATARLSVALADMIVSRLLLLAPDLPR